MFMEHKEVRFGDLDKKSAIGLDQAITQASEEVAKAERLPVEVVLDQLRGWPLMQNPRVMLVRALQKRAWRAERNRFKYYHLYGRQREFHAQGAAYCERLFSATNQLGKKFSGTYETAGHLAGRYLQDRILHN